MMLFKPVMSIKPVRSKEYWELYERSVNQELTKIHSNYRFGGSWLNRHLFEDNGE